ncbi:MarR family winged helix-turn-helix transcriptional regulator [Cohnella terricola]|uniref:MarR family transcriptional regulator n=1 Tax=Cohnella terricola TaxID=1289167 RepID=A0A559JEI3_9BACL|nr:MarR family transcriptional regulator [Cohnella terricola]TVX98276.1 MarR family transcriptional regulator [Cohnella terricola]
MDRNGWLSTYLEKFVVHRKMWESEWQRSNKSGFTSSQAFMLILLYQKGPMQAKELMENLAVSSGGITVISDKLGQLGYIRKIKTEQDRRAVFMEITDEGRKAYPDIKEEWEGVSRRIFSVLSDVEVAIMAQLFSKLVDDN